MDLDQKFWESRYLSGETGWDIGEISAPLRAWFDQLSNRELSIFIPGCGRAYEAEYLWRKGFRNLHLLDWSRQALQDFVGRVPDFPREQLYTGDFFLHKGSYDLIVEQTFFCALDPTLRLAYARHITQLLKPSGLLAGLLFDDPLNQDKPPYGGTEEEYRAILGSSLNILSLEAAENSIAPRAGRELFLLAQKPAAEPMKTKSI